MKITLSAILLLFLIGYQSLAQNDRRIHFGVNVFPNYSIGVVTRADNAFVQAVWETGVQKRETWKPSLGGQLFVEYTLSNKSRIGTGIGYYNNGDRLIIDEIITMVDPNTGDPVPDPGAPSRVKILYNSHHLEVPVYYKLTVWNWFFLRGGCSGLLNLSNTVRSVIYYNNKSNSRRNSKNTNDDYRTLNLKCQLGVGFNILQQEKLTLFFEPQVQYNLFSLNSYDPQFGWTGISAGTVVGVYF